MFDRILKALESNPYKIGIGLRAPTDWGSIIYSSIKDGKEVIVTIDNLILNYRLLHNWFTSAHYPPITIIPNKPQTINSYSYVKPFRCTVSANGNKIYAVQSDTHLYSLADKNKELVINTWFDTLDFPLNQTINGLHIIGSGTRNKIPFYIDCNLKIHHGAEIANMQKAKRFEEKNYKNKNVIRLDETQFKKLIVECVTKIISEIA